MHSACDAVDDEDMLHTNTEIPGIIDGTVLVVSVPVMQLQSFSDALHVSDHN